MKTMRVWQFLPVRLGLKGQRQGHPGFDARAVNRGKLTVVPVDQIQSSESRAVEMAEGG